MLKIPYNASNFSHQWGSDLSGKHGLHLTWNEIVWAAMTVGRPGVAYLLSHGWHSISDLVVRAHTIYANLCGNKNYIEKSNVYSELDPTEKSGVSYFMGMVAAKILASRLLNTPWLFHVSMIKSMGGSVVLKSKSQPDLLGLRNNRQWIVAEAKGRTWGYSASAMATAKNQTRQLRKINGQYPSLRVAVQASFNPRLEWSIEDPEEFNEDATDVEFDIENALEMYYSASTMATENGERRIIRNREYLVRELAEIGVFIGLDQDIRSRLKERKMSQIDLPSARDQETERELKWDPEIELERESEREFVLFDDGLAVSLDERWSEDRMIREPWTRRNG